MVGPIVLFTALEWFFPAEKGHDRKAFWGNVKLVLAYRIGTFLYVGMFATFTMWLMQHLPRGLIDLRFVTHGHFILDLAAALLWFLVFDFFYYWFHRFQHQWTWLWKQHQIHHSTTALNAVGAFTHHWLEDALRIPIVTIPFGILFSLNPFAAGLILVLANGWGYFIHANIRLNMGKFAAVFCGPQGHRIHHSIEIKHHNKNYAAFFPIWDIIFGTYFHPSKNEFPRTGVANYPMPLRFWNIMMDPLLFWADSIYLSVRNCFNRLKGNPKVSGVGSPDTQER